MKGGGYTSELITGATTFTLILFYFNFISNFSPSLNITLSFAAAWCDVLMELVDGVS